MPEGIRLRRLLKTRHISSKLRCLTDVALESTSPVTRRDRYRPLSGTLNDGFEVSLGPVPFAVVSKAKDGLINFIHARSSLVSIKNLLLRRYRGETVLWVTLDDAESELRRGLVGEITAVARLLQVFAAKHWRSFLDDFGVIRLTKVDFCRDYMGSFIPKKANKAYQ